jgi:hypothetical protein
MRLTPFALLALVPLIQACKEKEILPLKSTELLEAIPRVDNSTKSPCWQQRQIAAQNTAFDTALGKTKDVYKAPCDVDPPAKSRDQKTPVS